MPKPKTNVQLVKELMEVNRSGALAQAVVMTAIEQYCQGVVKNKKEVLKSMEGSLINGPAWVASCEEILGKVQAHFSKSVSPQPVDISEGSDICSKCGNVFEPGTLKAISEVDFDLICPACSKKAVTSGAQKKVSKSA